MKKQAPDDNAFVEHGGYMTVKINKLEDQFASLQEHLQKTKIFEGVSIFVNGRTNPSAEELKMIMIENGGVFHHYQRSQTKFIICSNLPDVKIRSASITKNLVKPEWIVDSLKEKRLLDYRKYLLYTKHNSAQPHICFKLSTEEIHVENYKTGTAVDRDFLQEFLKNSRLHHISSLSSGFKFYIAELRKKHDWKFTERDVLKKLPKTERVPAIPEGDIIMHIDMDCFFVSVGLKKYPHLRGKPVAVTHSKGRMQDEFISMSEIASCSYEARERGLRNGMFVGEALKLCPDLRTIPYDFEEYKRTAFTLYDTVAKYTLDIEAVSCDELYANLKSVIVECNINVMDFITLLRENIFGQTGCSSSVGIGSNRLQARLATKRAKPNGQFELLSIDVVEFMREIKITDLPGIGHSSAYNLDKLGLLTCGQLQDIPVHVLQSHFGKKFGEAMQKMSRGVDDRKLMYDQVRKSVSVDINYGIRFNEDSEVKSFLMQVCEELSKRLIEINRKGKCITLKTMMRAKDAPEVSKKYMGFGEADKCSKSAQLATYTNDPIAIFSSSVSILDALEIPPHDLRGIGVQVSKLDDEKVQTGSGKLLEMFKKISENGGAKKPLEPIDKINASPHKKSSTIKSGRPIKRIKSCNSFTSVTNMFAVQKPTKRRAIDPDVLSELPPDIVDEILRDYEFEETKPELSSLSKMETGIQAENIFMDPEWKTKVKTWIEAKDEIDKETFIICKSLTELVRTKNLECLFVTIRCLHRMIGEGDKNSWKLAYKQFYETLQDEMRNIFKKKLSAPYEF